MCDLFVVGSRARPYGAALDSQLDLQERTVPLTNPCSNEERRHAGSRPIAHGANHRMLVLGTMAMVLELAAVTAGLMLVADGMSDPGRTWPRIGHARVVAAAAPPSIAGRTLTQSVPMHWDLASEPAPPTLPQGCTSGPWASPLYPQNGVTLWDRIRDSSRNNRGAFLVGTAIQLHAPATAAILHVRSGLPDENLSTSTAATRPYWRRTSKDSNPGGCSR